MNKKILALVAGGILAVTFILYAVSNGVTNWSTYTPSGTLSSIYSISYGLWKICSGGNCIDIVCSSTGGESSASCSKFMAARAFLTLVCILTPIVAGCLIAWAFLAERFPEFTPKILKAGTSICFVFGLIGVVIGIAVTVKPDLGSSSQSANSLTISAGGIVGIIAIILNFAAGIVTGFI